MQDTIYTNDWVRDSVSPWVRPWVTLCNNKSINSINSINSNKRIDSNNGDQREDLGDRREDLGDWREDLGDQRVDLREEWKDDWLGQAARRA